MLLVFGFRYFVTPSRLSQKFLMSSCLLLAFSSAIFGAKFQEYVHYHWPDLQNILQFIMRGSGLQRAKISLRNIVS